LLNWLTVERIVEGKPKLSGLEMRLQVLGFIPALIVASFVSSPAGAVISLTGSTVSAQGFYPDLVSPFSPPTAPVVVGAGVEIPGGVITPGRGFGFDIFSSQIEYFAGENIQYGDGGLGAFNGFVLTFAGAPAITNVILNPATTLTPVAFSWTGNTVTLNYNGLLVSTSSITLLDVSGEGTTVPEPASIAVLGMGLLGIAGIRHRKRKA